VKCPACGSELTQMTSEDVTLDTCRGGCGGLWFDNRELPKVDEADQAAGEPFLHIDRSQSVRVDDSERRACPSCGDVVMMRHFSSVKRGVVVDECPQCGGYWLDAGELAAIREEFPTEEARRRAADAYFTEVFDKQMDEMRRADEAQVGRAHRIAHMFRFICPSYYIPGRQPWGAF
jgi:Zn-finger nucleic acid-binding protein